MICLNMETLNRIISITNEMKDKEERDVIVLRSAILNSIFYEIRKINTDIFIFVCELETGSEGDPERQFLAYANGDVLYDGFWFKELEEAIPLTYQRLARAYHVKRCADTGYDFKVSNVPDLYVRAINNRYLSARAYTQETVLEFYNTERFKF